MAIGLVISVDDSGIHIDTLGRAGRHSRPGRGPSILVLQDDLCVIDIETTGFSPDYDEIIEVSALRVRGGQVVNKFTSLVKPDNLDAVDEYITDLTGITQADLVGAPPLTDVLPGYFSFIGNDTLLGQNTSFDVNFLYDAAQRLGLPVFGNSYIDTRRMARLLFPSFTNYKLKTLAKNFNVSQMPTHRSDTDSLATLQCYQYMTAYIRENHFEDKLVLHHGTHKGLRAADIKGNPDLVQESSPLFGQTVVFTGALERMTRREAMQLVADLGGINGDSVTKKTNYLVLGNNDYCKTIKDGKSTKQKKAEKYILAGADLMIIPENVFYDMLPGGDTGTDGE